MSKTLCLTILALALAAGSGPAYSDEPPPEAIAEVTAAPETDTGIVPVLDAITQATPRYQPMVWTKHDAHAKGLKGNCKRCHHDLRGSNTTPGKCADCHNAPVSDMTLQETFHELCRNCHSARQAANQKHGPVRCLGCHKERD